MSGKKKCDRDRLIKDNLGLVFHLASRIHCGIPVRHELDDLVGYGMVGLAEAADSFVATRGAKFSTFAFFRIRGAIFDGLSESNWMSRAQYRRHTKRMNASHEQNHEAEEGGTENDSWELASSQVVELTKEHIEQISDSDASAPATVARDESASILCQCVESLPRREYRLITMIYFEGLSLNDAADRIGVSKSWASRLHAKILQKLGMDMVRGNKAPPVDNER